LINAAFSFLIANPFSWRADWAWGLPLIVLTVVIHVSGLALIFQRAVQVTSCAIERRPPVVAFVATMGTTTLVVTCLHGLEAALWAAAYLFLGALPNARFSMLYSLNALTSYGHTNLSLEDHWHLMGALEALNGWLLFGLTTAFLFAMMEKLWLLGLEKETNSTLIAFDAIRPKGS
jgi:hypothetical protein